MNPKQINRLLAVCIKLKTKRSCDIKICADHQLPKTLPDKHIFLDNEDWVFCIKITMSLKILNLQEKYHQQQSHSFANY